jgi:hypothetical protein
VLVVFVVAIGSSGVKDAAFADLVVKSVSVLSGVGKIELKSIVITLKEAPAAVVTGVDSESVITLNDAPFVSVMFGGGRVVGSGPVGRISPKQYQ